MKLKYQMYVREITHKGVALPQEIHDPKGCWRWMPGGGFIAADVTHPRVLKAPIDIFRWMAFCVPVEVVDRHIQVPRAYQRLGLFPRYGGNVVLFGGGDWCEIWDADKWVEQMRSTARDLENLMASVKDELEARC